MKGMEFSMRHIIDLSDLTDKEFNDLYKLTTNIIDRPEGYVDACRGKVLGSLFYEPSTRTNLSFSTAMMRLGGSVVGFSDPRSSSTTKGETLKDTINMVSCYADMIVMRNPREGAAKAASLYSSVPVINAGDGGHLHPTQTLADMVTILRMRGSADDMKIGLCGDLKYGRTVHSLLHFLERFHNVQVYLIAPDALKLPDYMISFLKEHNMPYCEVNSIDEVLPELDVLYMTRIQRERFTSAQEYENLEGSYQTLWVAPYGLKPRILELIDEQIAKGPEGYLCFKVNSVTEREVIDKLRQASQAGVEIKLIVRGICCLRPGVLHQTENIQVTSIVGRYLEHARVYVFGRGADAKYFIASADLMTRNLRRRVEIACPIFDQAIQDQLRYLLDLQLQDNAKASFLQPSGAYLRKEVHGPRIDSQAELMKTSLHRPEPDPVPRPNRSFFQRLMALLRGA